jgi:hypothetical protein
MFGTILICMLIKRNASFFQTTLESIRFFDPSAFHREFFNHFGAKDCRPPQPQLSFPSISCRCPATIPIEKSLTT